MTARGFGGQARNSPSEIPTLQYLLRVCNRSLLKRVIVEEFADPRRLADIREYRLMSKRLDVSLDVMCASPVAPKENYDWVLVPRESYILETSSLKITRRIHSDLVPCLSEGDVSNLLRLMGGVTFSYKKVKKVARSMKKSSLCVTIDEKNQYTETLGGERGYLFDRWDEILACPLWLEGSWCCRERYLALASAFCEMTFLEFECDKSQAKRACFGASRTVTQRSKQGRYLSGFDNAPKEAKKRVCRHVSNRRDVFDDAYRMSMAKKVAILNHNARCDFLESRIKLAQQQKRR